MITCMGSERPVTDVKISRDDDLLFVSSKDGVITLRNCETGERLGTYDGHKGAVLSICVDYVTKYLISGGGDSTIRLWEVTSGKQLYKFSPNKNRVTSVDFNCGDKLFLGATPQQLGEESFIHIYNNPIYCDSIVDENDEYKSENKDNAEDKKYKKSAIVVKNDLKIKDFKVSKALWSPLNKYIYAACSDGTIRVFDVEKEIETSKTIFDNKLASKRNINKSLEPNITDMKYCNDNTCLIASSRNFEAKMFELKNNGTMLNCMKTYSTNRGLNTVAVHPNQDKNFNCMCIAMGGGKTAQEVALTRGTGNYEILLKHTIFEETVGKIETDCISPLNTMTFNSDGSIFVCGYEEGTVRIFKMGTNFEKQFNHESKKFLNETIGDSDDD